MLYHAVIGKSNNDDAILGFEGYHSRKKLVRMYKAVSYTHLTLPTRLPV